MKIMLAMVLLTASSAASAVTMMLVSHQQTSASGTISTLITDGTHVGGFAASTAVWDWDGTTLSSTGIYSATSSLDSNPNATAVLNDHIVDLSINTTTQATATSFACNEGTFLSTVGANGCGDYTLGNNFLDDSTTVWSGLTATQTIGGDDVAGTAGPRLISAYDFDTVSFNGDGLHVGDEVLIGNGITLGVPNLGGELMTFSISESLAVDDAASTSPGLSVNISVLANDILDDREDEESMIVPDIVGLQVPAVSAGVAPQKGTVLVQGDLPGPRSGISILYTPDISFVDGTDTFNYTVTDQSVSVTATVTVTVTDAVGAVDDGTPAVPFGSVRVGQTISLDVLANDTGLNAVPLTVMAFLHIEPSLGVTTVTGSPGDASTIRISYTAGQAAGPDSFDYLVSANNGSMDDATVLVEVLPLDIPEADDDTATLVAEEPNSDDLPDNFIRVLDNDRGLVDTPLTVTITTPPANGRIDPIQRCDKQESCQVWYVPEPGFIGNDSFKYTVTDDTGESATANVAVTVIERPIAAADTVSTLANQSVTIDVLDNDSGLSNTPLSVILTDLFSIPATKGTVTIVGSPGDAESILIEYTPSGNGETTDSFEYTVTDNNGKSSPAKVTINITNVTTQDTVPGKSSVVGPVGLGLLLLLTWLRGRRQYFKENNGAGHY